MSIIINILHILVSVVLIVVVLLQSGKSAGLSGSIAGGAESFFGKNRGRTIDAMLSRWTSAVAIGFVITSVILTLLLV
jgi:preprotein translocase subunit SecG